MRTEDRKLARQIADTLDDAGRNVLSEQAITAFTEKIRDSKAKAAADQILRDVFRSVSGREFGAGSLRAFADSWLAGIKPQLSPRSYPKYDLTVRSFVSFLAAAADRDLIGFGARDDVLVLRFRDDMAKRLSAASVNTRLKVVKQMFKAAAQRFKIESPAHFVSGVRKDATQATQRRAFKLPELGRILRAARESEWEGIILVGLYTGQRLSDIVMLRWENVDLARTEIALTTRKTNRRVLIPIATPLLDYLLKIPTSDNPKELLFVSEGDKWIIGHLGLQHCTRLGSLSSATLPARMHIYEIISGALPFGRLWYGEPSAVSNALNYAGFFSRSRRAVIRIYDEAGNLIGLHEHAGEFKEP